MSTDSLYSLKTTTLAGKPADLSQHEGKDGTVVAFFPSKVAPEAKQLREAIEAALAR